MPTTTYAYVEKDNVENKALFFVCFYEEGNDSQLQMMKLPNEMSPSATPISTMQHVHLFTGCLSINQDPARDIGLFVVDDESCGRYCSSSDRMAKY